MRKIKISYFEKDQHIIVKIKSNSKYIKKIEQIIKKDNSYEKNYEKVWIPNNHVKGLIKKMNYESFKMINSCFTNGLKEQFEKSTCLQDLELVAVRRNKLKTNG
ncbi:hypothetical protein N9D29_00175 [Flavobacteriaceae bacterium]|jgi:hypothetical protein|nr:hypothetical protein [Flavobacteriaceae bacterium]